MKMSSMIAMALIGGAGIMGYMYLKKNPQMMKKVMKLGKDTSKVMYNTFDENM